MRLGERGSLTARAPGHWEEVWDLSRQGSGERQWRGGDWGTVTPLEAKAGPVLMNIPIRTQI